MRSPSNDEHQDKVEVVSSTRKIFFFIVLGYSSFLIPFSLFLLLLDEPLAFLGLSLPWFIFALLIYAIFASWSSRTKFSLTRISLEIFVDKTLFLELNWDEIERIIVFKEERKIQITRYRIKDTMTGYSLRIKGDELDKTIRLWCFGFGLRNQEKIVAFLKTMCKKITIQISIDDTPKRMIERQEFPCEVVSQFREALKLEKKEKSAEKAIDGGRFW